MSSEFDLLKEEYVALRSEICQSIAKQHQITLAGYALTVAIFGYVVAKEPPPWEALAVIPFALLAMTSLWTVECNRMVRAGYYIGYILWPALKKVVSATQDISWETWIRSREGNASDFGNRQHHLQLFVILAVPITVSVSALGVANFSLWYRYSIAVIVLTMVVLSLWIFMVWQVRKVSNLAAITPDSHTDMPSATSDTCKSSTYMKSTNK